MSTSKKNYFGIINVALFLAIHRSVRSSQLWWPLTTLNLKNKTKQFQIQIFAVNGEFSRAIRLAWARPNLAVTLPLATINNAIWKKNKPLPIDAFVLKLVGFWYTLYNVAWLYDSCQMRKFYLRKSSLEKDAFHHQQISTPFDPSSRPRR